MTRLLALLLLVPLVPPTQPYGQRVCVLLDVSGSMETGERIQQALGLVRQITHQPVDDGHLIAYAFDVGASRCPRGWVALPDAEGVAQTEAWLDAQRANGHTQLGPALVRVLSEPHKGLTVVVVTDGDLYQDSAASILATLEAQQRKREKAGLGKAVVGVLGVGHTEPRHTLKALAVKGGGGYWVAGE